MTNVSKDLYLNLRPRRHLSLRAKRVLSEKGGATERSELSAQPGANRVQFAPTQVKLIRAQGECLGTESRRRTRQAAISCGEEQISIDPQISEWGNPAGQYPVILH